MTILKATEAAISEKGMSLEAKNYFSALFPLLDDEKRDASLKNDQNRIIEFNTAVCYLLAFVFPRLEADFLREIYSSDGTMFATLSHSMRRFHLIAPFVRSICTITGSVLAAHAQADWKEEQSSLGELFVILLGWTVDSRPKVRRISQETISKLLNLSGGSQAAEFTTEFVSSALLNATRKDPSVPIQLFPLMKQLLPSLNSSACPLVDGLDNLITGLLNCLNLGNTRLTVSGYEIIQNYTQEQVEKTEEIDPDRLGRVYGVVKRIFDGILKQKPTCDLVELSVAFLPALAQCTLLTIHLQQLLQKDPSGTLQTCLQVILQGFFMKSTDGSVLNASGSALLSVFFGLFDRLDAEKFMKNGDLLHQIAIPALLARDVSGVIIPSQGRQLQDAMISLRFAAFMPVAARLTEILGESSVKTLGPMILQIARLHDCRYLTCRDDLVRVIAVLIRVAGLPETLKLLPMNLIKTPGSEESPRAWMLPILRDSIYNTSLSAWIELVAPIAQQVSIKAEGLRSAEKAHEARVWDTLHAQLLSMLPAILASFPTDFASTFPQLSDLLARFLNDDAQLRPTLMAALQGFIQNSRSMLDAQVQGGVDEIGLLRPLTCEQIEADLAILTSAMPQFLPILFNIYAATTSSTSSMEEDDDSAAASSDLTLKLIETLLGLTEEGVVADYFSKTVARIERMRDVGSWAMLGTVLELAGTMIPHASSSSLISNFIPAVLPLLSSADCDVSLQKKAYRGIVRALTREDVRGAVMGSKEQCEALYNALTSASESLHSAAKKIRFKILSLIASELPDDSLLWIPQFLPEVLLGIKEVNYKTRSQAYELIISWGRRMSLGGEFVGFDGSMRSASLQEFINMVLAGLAGNTPHMISATIMALARIIFEFAPTMKASGEEAIVSSLTGDICMLLQSPSREIVKSAISFVKVSLVILDSETLDPLLPGLVEGLLLWANVHHHQFKLQVRHLMERLMRRFGFERMEQVTPAEHHALLANIKKRREKTKKQQKKEKMSTVDDETVSPSVAPVSKAALSRASKRSQFLMGEDGEEGGSRSNGISNRARFEHALNDSEESDFDDEEDGNDANGRSEDVDEKISNVMNRKLNLKSTVSLKSVMTQRLPNISRKQQEQLKRQLHVQESQEKKRRRSEESSDEEVDDDDDVRFGSDGKLHVGAGELEKSAGDMDKIYRAAMSSFKRSADGKHVKFARGTKANLEDDFEDDGDYSNKSLDTRSTAGFSGISRKTNYSGKSNFSGSGKSVRSASTSISRAHSGSQFRAKKGSSGDAKRKGAQFDPYAYVPIQRKSGKHGGRKEKTSEKYFMNNNKRARK